MNKDTYYVYMILCADGSYYTGIAKDPAKRFQVHKSGKGAKYFRKTKPVSFVKIVVAKSRPEALKAEAVFKKYSHQMKRSLFNNSFRRPKL
jgi:putative endonuclease